MAQSGVRIPMKTRNRRSLATGGLLLGLSLVAVPACEGSGGHRREAGPPYVTYRPAFPEGNARPLFLNSYAGYNYGQGPRASYAPTGYLADYHGRPAIRHHLFGWHER